MKKTFFLFAAFLVFITMSGCAAIGTIFKAGMFWGIFLVLCIIGLIVYLVSRNK